MKYKVKFIDYPLAYKNIKKEVGSAISRVLKNGDLVFRKDMIDLEKKIAKLVGVKYGIGTDSCTGALFISLKAAGIKEGDEVITVSHTYVATIDVIVHAGAKPVLVDVQDDFNIDPDLIEKAITSRTKAIIPVHLNGRCADMDKIMEIARKHNLLVIEDAAQALGAKYNGKMAGSFGLTGCFSFYPAKVLGSYGEGGMVTTDSKELADKLYLLRDHGEKPSYLKTEEEKSLKEIAFYGYNTILDNLQAAVLNVKLRHFSSYIKKRREIASLYNKELKMISRIKIPLFDGDKYFDVFQNYVIYAEKRDELMNYLKKKGIETLVSWAIPNHRQKALTNLHEFNLPKTEKISKEVLSLPMYPELKKEEILYVVKCIKSFYENF